MPLSQTKPLTTEIKDLFLSPESQTLKKNNIMNYLQTV